MTLLQRISCWGFCLGLAATVPAATQGQQSGSARDIGNPLTGPPVRKAPFSAEATTTVQQTLRDGTRIDRTSIVRYYRNGAGRVRVEQTIRDWESLNPGAEKQLRITIDTTPGGGGVYVLDPLARKAGETARDLASLVVGGGSTFALPLGGTRFLIFRRPERAREHWARLGTSDVKEESLGNRRFAGVDTTGRRVTITIPIGQAGNDRPIEVLDERWESPELQLVIYSRSVDPREGVIEYRLANIRQMEPDSSLFVVPAHYTRGFSGISLVYADTPTPQLTTERKEMVDQLKK
jgi:hypothetical protein